MLVDMRANAARRKVVMLESVCKAERSGGSVEFLDVYGFGSDGRGGVF